MDFFEHQERARRNTRVLVGYFAVAVVLIVVSVYLAVWLAFALRRENASPLWHLDLFLYSTAGALVVILGGSLHKVAQLSQGGSAVATMLGGRPVDGHTTDPDERKLLNVVEEMAIASGIPMPSVYLLPQEEGINAFAAGYSTSDAAVGVTRGCLRRLTRDELQGVVAHEFSHILNGDMRLNLRLIGILSGILVLAIIGRILLRTRGRRNPLPLFGLLLLIIGFIGMFFGRLIKSAISRQREFLADAAAVQFTRNPEGITGALKKIGGLAHGSRVRSAYAEEASHLFFGNALAESWSRKFSTHPPLADRIRAIDPSFDGKFPDMALSPAEPAHRRSAPRHPPPAPRPIPAADLRDLLGARFAATVTDKRAAPHQSALPRVGTPESSHLRYAADFKAALPENIRQAATETLPAAALTYALLITHGEGAKEPLLDQLKPRLAPPVCQELLRLLPEVQTLPEHFRLPLLLLTLPALRSLAVAQYREFQQNLQFIVQHDRQVDLFEYALQKIVMRHLDPHFGPARRGIIQYYALKPLLPDCAVLLSALTRLGTEETALREKAFRLGTESLGMAAPSLPMPGPDMSKLAQIDAALNRLAQASPMLKKRVLTACALAVAADQVIQPPEAELLRAIADTLDCPVPPLVEGL